MYHPTLSGLDSHTMMLSCNMLLVDRQALSEHTTTSSSTESVGQALRVSLVKPGAYLSESYARQRQSVVLTENLHQVSTYTPCFPSPLPFSPMLRYSTG